MIIKYLKHPYDIDDIQKEPIVLILGFFDGVHRGHQAVIKRGVQIAKEKGLKSALMTFNRHPSIVYRSFSPEDYGYLTLDDEKQKRIRDLGVDYYYQIEFTSSFGGLSPQQFIDQYIVDWRADTVVAGFDYTYGPADIANMQTLPDYAKGRFEIECVGKQMSNGEVISSTRIKENIRRSEIELANRDLGYIYLTRGFVIHGAGRGKHLGYPTANIFSDPPHQILPGIGVYAVKVELNGQSHTGMASIGYNVTFEEKKRLNIEINLFDFDQKIYGENLVIEWHQYLRGESKFNHVDELIDQLSKDEIDCRQYFANLENKHIN